MRSFSTSSSHLAPLPQAERAVAERKEEEYQAQQSVEAARSAVEEAMEALEAAEGQYALLLGGAGLVPNEGCDEDEIG